MKTLENICVMIAILLGLGILMFGGVRCSAQNKQFLLNCIEKTGKPLECEASMRGQL